MRKNFCAITIILINFCFFPLAAKAAVAAGGWYDDHRILTSDTGCPVGQWRAQIDVRDNADQPLTVGTLNVLTKWVRDDNGNNQIEAAETRPVDTFVYNNVSTVLTDCMDVGENGTGRMIMQVSTVRSGYYPLFSSNDTKFSGPFLSQKKWTRILYPVSMGSSPNIGNIFPVDSVTLNNSNVAFQTYVRRRPNEPVLLTKISLIAENNVTHEIFTSDRIISVTEATLTFPVMSLSDGRYSWKVSLMEDDSGVYYSEPGPDYFYIDTTPPTITEMSAHYAPSNNHIIAYAVDTGNYSSGIKRIRIYNSGGTLLKECTYTTSGIQNCEADITGAPLGNFLWYVTVEDNVGNIITSPVQTTSRQQPTYSFSVETFVGTTTGGLPLVGNSETVLPEVYGVYMELLSGTPASCGNRATQYTCTSSSPFEIEIKATSTYQGQPFGFFWGCYDPDNTARTCHAIVDDTNPSQGVHAFYGASLLGVHQHANHLLNTGVWGVDINRQLLYDLELPLPVNQTGGTPQGIGGAATCYYKFISGGVNNAVLHANDPASGVLKFSYWSGCGSVSGFENRDCNLTYAYSRRDVYMYFYIVRSLSVDSFVNGGSNPGAPITKLAGPSDLASQNTNFLYSTTGTVYRTEIRLEAPLIHKNEFFTKWVGCSSVVGADNNICIIATSTWFNSVSAAVTAYYGVLPENIGGGGTVVGQVKVETSLHGIISLPLYDPEDPGVTDSSMRIFASGTIRAFDLVPTNATSASPVRVMMKNGIIKAIRILP